MPDSMEPTLTTTPSPLTRADIRAVVERNNNELRSVANAGGNVHQVGLDQMDAFFAMIAAYPKEQRDEYEEICNQELEAQTKHLMNNTNTLNAETARIDATTNAILADTAIKTAGTELVARTIGAIIIIGFLMFVLFSLLK